MKTRVLIVDDEPIARRGVRRYLAEHNSASTIFHRLGVIDRHG